MQKFVKNIIAFSLKNHVLVLFLIGLLAIRDMVNEYFFDIEICSEQNFIHL